MLNSKLVSLAAVALALGSVNAVPCKEKSSSTTAAPSSTSAVVDAADASSTASSTASAATASSSANSTSSASGSSGSTNSSSSTVSASSGCTFTDFSDVADGKGSCSTIVISAMTVPAGETLDLTDLADNTVVQFQGKTTWEYQEWEGPLLSISGTGIQVSGDSGHSLDGNGAEWWDGEGSNGGKTKPKMFYAHDLTDSSIENLNILNSPVQMMSINGASNLTVSGLTFDNSAGDGDDGGHNTDAFDIGSSTGVTITGSTIKNQDDCMAVNSGSDITFTDNTCSGGHGISIGSVGGRDDNDVSDVTVKGCTISDSQNGVRIKTVSGATGSVKGVTYSGITLSGITDYGIVIEQDYENGSPTGTPTDGVPITDLTIEDVTGTVESDATDIYILCASCSDWTWSGVDVTGGKTSTDCTGIPTGASC